MLKRAQFARIEAYLSPDFPLHLAQRWSCCTKTVKRRTGEGKLHPIRFSARMIRYQLSEIIQVERQGGAIT